jgi:hypothetical protein
MRTNISLNSACIGARNFCVWIVGGKSQWVSYVLCLANHLPCSRTGRQNPTCHMLNQDQEQKTLRSLAGKDQHHYRRRRDAPSTCQRWWTVCLIVYNYTKGKPLHRQSDAAKWRCKILINICLWRSGRLSYIVCSQEGVREALVAAYRRIEYKY